MTERLWDQLTAQRHVYTDARTGAVLGVLHRSFVNKTYTAWAYDQRVGEYVVDTAARVAVELACEDIEKMRAEVLAKQNAAKEQADGATE